MNNEHAVHHIYNQYNSNWTSNNESNEMFLRHVQNLANDLLKIRGHVFLNDIYDMLSMRRTSHGAISGWFYDGETERPWVQFGIHGRTEDGSIILEINVDDIIYEKI